MPTENIKHTCVFVCVCAWSEVITYLTSSLMAYVQDCDIRLSKFELRPYNYASFQSNTLAKSMTPTS